MSGEAPLEAVKVLTFFEAGYDLKHASALRLLLETAEAPLPPRLVELAEVDPRTQLSYEQSFGEDPKEKQKYDRAKSGGASARTRTRTTTGAVRRSDGATAPRATGGPGAR